MTRWLFWTLVTVVSWGIWAVLAKQIADEIPSPAHSQVASTLGILPVLAMLWLMKDEPTTSGQKRRGLLLALGAGIVSCLGNIAYFDVFGRGGKAAAVIPITALYPAITVLLAIPILGERLNRPQWFGIGLSLAAIWLFNVPGAAGMFSGWLLFVLIPIGLWGLCGLMQKMSTDHISARSSAIWFLLSFIPVGIAIAMVDPLPGGWPWQTWLLAAGVGLTLAIGNFTILLAFASGGKASIIAPLAGLYPLVSIPIAMVHWGERIGRRESLGIVCALAAVVLLSYQSQPEAERSATLEADTRS